MEAGGRGGSGQAWSGVGDGNSYICSLMQFVQFTLPRVVENVELQKYDNIGLTRRKYYGIL